MLFAVVYLELRRLVGLAGGSAEDRHSDIEVLVLRHQLAVLSLFGQSHQHARECVADQAEPESTPQAKPCHPSAGAEMSRLRRNQTDSCAPGGSRTPNF